MNNPWLQIPAQDYEAHMASPEVGQLQVLSSLFETAISETKPSSLAVLGCCTGNGFEHIAPDITTRIVGVDINPSYLDILRRRFSHKLHNLCLIQDDFTSASFRIDPVDMVFAALIFEYVNVDAALNKIVESLVTGGMLVVVLQMQSQQCPPVSPTKYASLRALTSIMKLVDIEGFTKACSDRSLVATRTWELPLKPGKAFYVGYFKKETEPSVPPDRLRFR